MTQAVMTWASEAGGRTFLLATEVTPVFQRKDTKKRLAFKVNPGNFLGWNCGSICFEAMASGHTKNILSRKEVGS